MFQPHAIRIGDYVVTQLIEADIYELFFAFIGDTVVSEEDVDDTINDFVDDLVERDVVHTNVEGDVEGTANMYLTWWDLPTAQDVADALSVLPSRTLSMISRHQRDMFATGYRLPVFAEAGFNRSVYFQWLGDPEAGRIEDKAGAIMRSAMERADIKHIAAHGWGIRGVGGGEVNPPFVYTIGLSAKIGLELMLVGPMAVGQEMLNDIAERLVNGETMEQITTLHDHRVKETQAPLRAGFKELAADSEEALNAAGRVKGIEVTRIVQVLYGDKNNILPGEPGYDETLVQHLVG